MLFTLFPWIRLVVEIISSIHYPKSNFYVLDYYKWINLPSFRSVGDPVWNDNTPIDWIDRFHIPYYTSYQCSASPSFIVIPFNSIQFLLSSAYPWLITFIQTHIYLIPHGLGSTSPIHIIPGTSLTRPPIKIKWIFLGGQILDTDAISTAGRIKYQE